MVNNWQWTIMEGGKATQSVLVHKTFVNAHLIKTGLVGIDGSYEYRYRGKFLTLVLRRI